MLFILTGGVQIGKTRWLEQLVGDLAAEGVSCCGVIAPGVWRLARDAEVAGADRAGSGARSFDGAGDDDSRVREKVGIDNVLLPQNERICFATRRDLLPGSACGYAEGRSQPPGDEGIGLRATSQSDKASLGWAIYDDALARANEHFDKLRRRERIEGVRNSELLVVDEIGRLELEHGRGLVCALRVLDDGPQPGMPHALAVVRDWLVPDAEHRFGTRWGEQVVIGPDSRGRRAVRNAFGLGS